MRGTRWLRGVGGLLLTALAVALAGCTGDGHFTLFGYTTVPNYDQGIHTVYVPIFKNVSYRRGLEFYLTQAIVREIEAKTPFRVTDCRERADTELIGTIVGQTKSPVVLNQLNEVRNVEMTLTVELYWKDLRAGHVGDPLSLNKPRRADEPPLKPGDPQPPVIVQSLAQFTPEVGLSRATAEKDMADRIAVQIVSMMEKAW
jgi:hypothetical protein